MKTKIGIALLVGICGIASAYTRYQASWSVTLTTSDQIIAPNIDHTTTNQWAASTAYVVGDYVINSSGRMYFCTIGGTTATVEPTHRGGVYYDDNFVYWYCVPDNRRNVTVQLTEGGTDAWILEGGFTADADYSRLLTGKGMAYVFEDYRGEIHGRAASGTVKVTVTEN